MAHSSQIHVMLLNRIQKIMRGNQVQKGINQTDLMKLNLMITKSKNTKVAEEVDKSLMESRV